MARINTDKLIRVNLCHRGQDGSRIDLPQHSTDRRGGAQTRVDVQQRASRLAVELIELCLPTRGFARLASGDVKGDDALDGFAQTRKVERRDRFLAFFHSLVASDEE